ncbi:MAG: alcohol dehydrogenase catalytic domain-containing protein, partial [Proteobacteria bacterium]|nr:alcohol dehydrogenase catalytic domain-containing protein [Pseudomonadota bacterium]
MDAVTDLVHAPLWGLIRSARSEHADRVLRLVDLGAADVSTTDVASVLSADTEPELAWRYGVALAGRLRDAAGDSLQVPSEEPAWRLDLPERGSLQHLRAIEAREALAPLAAGEVRVEVRASGINFRDVLNALGMVAAPWLGLEVSGVVVEVGEGVTSLSVGQRVLGLGRATFATLATADARLLTPTPAGLTDVEAAT